MSLVPRTARKPGSPRRLPRRAAYALAALLLAACATGDNATARLARDFGGIEIRRIGDFNPGFIEFQDRAIVNAFDALLKSGVEREAITLVTVSTPARASRSSFVFAPGLNLPPYYELWVAVEGCDKNVYFRSGSAGVLQTTLDKGGCMSGG